MPALDTNEAREQMGLPGPKWRLTITNGPDAPPEFVSEHDSKEGANAERERLNVLGFSVQQICQRWVLISTPDIWSSGSNG
jgi:hypothetical protein